MTNVTQIYREDELTGRMIAVTDEDRAYEALYVDERYKNACEQFHCGLTSPVEFCRYMIMLCAEFGLSI